MNSAIISPASWTGILPLSEVFRSPAPIEVDVGCGKGRFILARAKACPGVNFLGIDRLLRRLRKIDRKIMREGVSNVRLLRLEASYAIKYMLAPDSVSAYYIFFPDPWPKRRHHKRRLFNKTFMDSLYGTLLPGGQAHVTTDHTDYFNEIVKLFAGDGRFEQIPALELSDAERTNFETLYIKQGKPIGRCSFRKRSNAGPPTRNP